jgi:hypothetical protein
LQAVVTDLDNVSTDTGNQQFGTAANDGQSLVIDAARAELNPPPESRSRKAEYEKWMQEAGYLGAAAAQYDTASEVYSAQQSAPYKAAVQEASGKCAAEGA